jgi:hypothetical protein
MSLSVAIPTGSAYPRCRRVAVAARRQSLILSPPLHSAPSCPASPSPNARSRRTAGAGEIGVSGSPDIGRGRNGGGRLPAGRAGAVLDVSPSPPGPARPRVPPSRMAWAAAAPTARRQAASASARRARRRHPSQKAQWGTPVAASAQQTRSRRRGSVSPNADYPLRDGASPMPAFPAGSAKQCPGRAGCTVLAWSTLFARNSRPLHRHPRA